MKYGKKTIRDFSVVEKEVLLSEIIDKCVVYAGDSYEDFTRAVVKKLVEEKLVDYGE